MNWRFALTLQNDVETLVIVTGAISLPKPHVSLKPKQIARIPYAKTKIPLSEFQSFSVTDDFLVFQKDRNCQRESGKRRAYHSTFLLVRNEMSARVLLL